MQRKLKFEISCSNFSYLEWKSKGVEFSLVQQHIHHHRLMHLDHGKLRKTAELFLIPSRLALAPARPTNKPPNLGCQSNLTLFIAPQLTEFFLMMDICDLCVSHLDHVFDWSQGEIFATTANLKGQVTSGLLMSCTGKCKLVELVWQR